VKEVEEAAGVEMEVEMEVEEDMKTVTLCEETRRRRAPRAAT